MPITDTDRSAAHLNASREARRAVQNAPATRTFTSTRQFGVEIEFCTTKDRHAIAAILTQHGINVQVESYNHTTRSHWKIVPDGSVVSGFELVSPPLSGMDGISQVQTALKALFDNECWADTSCGLHVHVDAAGLSGPDVVNVLRRYARHEETIDAIVPTHRRNNQFARSVGPDFLMIEDYVRNNPNASTSEICERMTNRYRKLNLASYVKHGTLEFRQHSGSLDGTKVANWIQFCVQFVEDSKVTVRQVAPAPRPVAPAPTVPTAPASPAATVASPFPQTFVRERLNARSRQWRRLLEIFRAAGIYVPVSATTIATRLQISESSVPSMISAFRAAYPGLRVERAIRGRGYYTTTMPQTIERLLAQDAATPPRGRGDGTTTSPPAAILTGGRTLGSLITEHHVRTYGAPGAGTLNDWNSHRREEPVTVVEIPDDAGLFANLTRQVASYYAERALDLL
jgi:hypothetical protein